MSCGKSDTQKKILLCFQLGFCIALNTLVIVTNLYNLNNLILKFEAIVKVPEVLYLTAQPHPEIMDKVYFTQCLPTWSEKTDTIFMLCKMGFFYLLPLFFMSIAYMQIIKVLWKSGDVQSMEAGKGRSGGAPLINTFAMNMNASTEGQLRSRKKAAKMLVCVVAMFAICFLPVHLLSVLRLTLKLTNSDMNQAFSLISHWLCYANSAINPIIYNFMSGKFRKEFRRSAFDCHRRDPREEFRCSTFRSQKQQQMYAHGAAASAANRFSFGGESAIRSRPQSHTDFEIRMNTYSRSGDHVPIRSTKQSLL